jgi:hypothetical protein
MERRNACEDALEICDSQSTLILALDVDVIYKKSHTCTVCSSDQMSTISCMSNRIQKNRAIRDLIRERKEDKCMLCDDASTRFLPMSAVVSQAIFFALRSHPALGSRAQM